VDDLTEDLFPEPVSKKDMVEARNPGWTDAEVEEYLQEWETEEAQTSNSLWKFGGLLEMVTKTTWATVAAIIVGVLALAAAGLWLLGVVLDGSEDTAEQTEESAAQDSPEPAGDPEALAGPADDPAVTTAPPPPTVAVVPIAGTWQIVNRADTECALGSASTENGSIEVFEDGARLLASGFQGGAAIDLTRSDSEAGAAIYTGTLTAGMTMNFTFAFATPDSFEARGEVPGTGCFLAGGTLAIPAEP
jgi:hypothetical protein